VVRKPRQTISGGFMKFDPGIIAIAIAMLLFYARLAQIRGHKRKEQRQEQLAHMRSKRKGRVSDSPATIGLNYEVGNYYLLALGAVLMLMGMMLRTSDILPAMYKPYWWEIVTAGVVAFIFCVK
jgi:hypothetical protein